MDRNSSVTLPADAPDFILTRFFDAPRALVWKCWVEPSHLARWFGPRGFTCPVCEIDPQVGGKFRIVIRSADGADYAMFGVFREIVPMARIVKEDDMSEHSEEWKDMVDPGRKGDAHRQIRAVTTVSFAEEADGTRVTVHMAFPSPAMRDNFVKTGMVEGWSSTLDRLEDLTAALKGSDRTITFSRVLAASPELVFACFHDPVHISNWWGPNGFSTTTYEMDFRVGGVWRYTMHGPDGTDYPNFVSYTEIVPSRRIAYDHGTSAENPKMFEALITFAEEGAKTRVTLQLTLQDSAQREHMIAFGAVEGGWQTLVRLDAFLSSSPRPAR
jgi:uncharacterized protein YndB with AHSA1/START domain